MDRINIAHTYVYIYIYTHVHMNLCVWVFMPIDVIPRANLGSKTETLQRIETVLECHHPKAPCSYMIYTIDPKRMIRQPP